MKIMIFDTETTGLINNKELDLNKQPRIVQFAYIIWELDKDWKWEKQEEGNFIINPEIKIPHQVSEIHWIWDVDVKWKPTAKELMPEIIEKINGVDFIVAHNLKFDEAIVKLEIERMKVLWMPVDFLPKGRICTMIASTNICRLSKPSWASWYKSPKLQEMFYFLFWKYFKWAHDAMQDVKACGYCFVELVKRKQLDLKKIESKQITFF